MTALQALKMPYFTDCVDSVVLIDDEVDEYNDESDYESLTDESHPPPDQTAEVK